MKVFQSCSEIESGVRATVSWKVRATGEIKKPSSAVNVKIQRKTREWERRETSSRKLEITREHFMKR